MKKFEDYYLGEAGLQDFLKKFNLPNNSISKSTYMKLLSKYKSDKKFPKNLDVVWDDGEIYVKEDNEIELYDIILDMEEQIELLESFIEFEELDESIRIKRVRIDPTEKKKRALEYRKKKTKIKQKAKR